MKEKKIGTTVVRLLQGDITACEVDAIVKTCHGVPSQAVLPLSSNGDVVFTSGNGYKAKYILETAFAEKKTQINAHVIRRTMQLILERAQEHQLESLAMPALGAGPGGMPADKCADILLQELTESILQVGNSLKKVVFVFHNQKGYKCFEQALTKI